MHDSETETESKSGREKRGYREKVRLKNNERDKERKIGG